MVRRLRHAFLLLGALAQSAAAYSRTPASRTPASRTSSARPARQQSPQHFRRGVAVDYGMFHPRANLPPETLRRMVARTREAGVDHVRFEIPMRESLDIANHPDHPAVRAVSAFRTAGVDVTAVVGVGSKAALPRGLKVDDPRYIEKVSQNVFDVVTALKKQGVTEYQIENELNAAGATSIKPWSWREGSRWWDPAFKLQLLESLGAAVKRADPNARIRSNLNGNVSDPIDFAKGGGFKPARGGNLSARGLVRIGRAFFGRDTHLERAARLFSPRLDDVGYDFYSNYVVPYGWPGSPRDPGALLRDQVQQLESWTGKPIAIDEIGISSVLGKKGMTDYVRTMTRAAEKSGATGMTWFRLADAPGMRSRPWQLGPNQAIEPRFGLLDEKLEPKRYTTHEWTTRRVGPLTLPWRSRRTGSAWDEFVASKN